MIIPRDGKDVLLTDENGRTNRTSITIGFQGISHGSDIGIKNYVCILDAAPSGDCQSGEYGANCTPDLSSCTISKDFDSPGPHFFNVQVIDTRGGQSHAAHIIWWIIKSK
jgi:hypothetical protein